MKKNLKALMMVMAFMVLAVSLLQAGEKGLSYPNDYRSWTHSKSMVISDKSHPLAGFHHIYVNEEALKAYKSGGNYPDGSEFAVPFFEVLDDKGTVSQGKKVMTAVMKKDKSAAETGGWLYGAFDPEGKAMAIDVVKGCFECHKEAEGTGYIFSKFVE